MNHFEQACDSVDAAIFTGETLWDDAQRQKLKDYLARWGRAVEEHERLESSSSSAVQSGEVGPNGNKDTP